VAVGVVAESRGGMQMVRPAESATASNIQLPPPATGTPAVAPGPAAISDSPGGTRRPAADRAVAALPVSKPAAPGAAPDPARWQTVTLPQIEAAIDFSRLPPDDGVVTPIAQRDEDPEPEIVGELDRIQRALPQWKPGLVTDPVQRVRNHLFVAIVPDLFQVPTERFVPHIVFDRLEAIMARDDLIKILYWIAVHPDEGDDKALDDLHSLGFGNGPSEVDEVRVRTGIYAVKFLGRLMGKIKVEAP
jgi:hypothetical protein